MGMTATVCGPASPPAQQQASTPGTSPTIPLLLADNSNSYIYGPENLSIEQISSAGTPTYLHHDQLGSTRLITGQTGATLARYTYNPYGKLAARHGASSPRPATPANTPTPKADCITCAPASTTRPTGQFLTVDPLATPPAPTTPTPTPPRTRSTPWTPAAPT